MKALYESALSEEGGLKRNLNVSSSLSKHSNSPDTGLLNAGVEAILTINLSQNLEDTFRSSILSGDTGTMACLSAPKLKT